MRGGGRGEGREREREGDDEGEEEGETERDKGVRMVRKMAPRADLMYCQKGIKKG